MRFFIKKIIYFTSSIFLFTSSNCETFASQIEEPTIIYVKNNTNRNISFYYFNPPVRNIKGVLTPMQHLISYTSPLLPYSSGKISISGIPFNGLEYLEASSYYEVENTDCFVYFNTTFNGQEQLTALTCGVRDKRPYKPSICRSQFDCKADINTFTVNVFSSLRSRPPV